MFNNDFYDIETEPLITLKDFYGEPKHLIDKCLIIFSKNIYQYLLDNFDCKLIGEVGSCNGKIPVHNLMYKGEKIGFYLSMITSAAASEVCYEVHYITGATKFVMFGSCGSLDKEKTRGKYVIPIETYRGEGTSFYYVPASDYLTIKNSGVLATYFENNNIPYVLGRNWTVDSMLRETKGLMNKRKQEGCISVEMELAGVQAICDFYKLDLYNFLECGDVLSESGYELKELHKANHDVAKALIALNFITSI